MTAIVGVHGIELGVSDLEASTRFYRDVWGVNAGTKGASVAE